MTSVTFTTFTASFNLLFLNLKRMFLKKYKFWQIKKIHAIFAQLQLFLWERWQQFHIDLEKKKKRKLRGIVGGRLWFFKCSHLSTVRSFKKFFLIFMIILWEKYTQLEVEKHTDRTEIRRDAQALVIVAYVYFLGVYLQRSSDRSVFQQ